MLAVASLPYCPSFFPSLQAPPLTIRLSYRRSAVKESGFAQTHSVQNQKIRRQIPQLQLFMDWLYLLGNITQWPLLTMNSLFVLLIPGRVDDVEHTNSSPRLFLLFLYLLLLLLLFHEHRKCFSSNSTTYKACLHLF